MEDFFSVAGNGSSCIGIYFYSTRDSKHAFNAQACFPVCILISIIYLCAFEMSLCMVFSMNWATKYLGQTATC